MTQSNRTELSLPSFTRVAGRIMVIGLSIVLAGILLLVGVLLAWSPGMPRPFLDGNGRPLAGSISEKIRVKVNGIEQGMFIQGKDAASPVLLYLHGGMPEYFLTQGHPTGLEEHFVVVWWEQRGSGLSFYADNPPETITSEQMISDALEVTKYLRRRFGKEKIFLMGHSGGTFIGIQAAARAPALYHAYIGVAQMSHQLRSETLAYEYMLQRFEELGDRAMVRRLGRTPVTLTGGVPRGYLSLRDEAMHSLGIGTTHDMTSAVTGIFLPLLRFREYTLGEKVQLWTSKSRAGVSVLWDTMLATDLSKAVPQLAVPVYFFHGIYDHTVSYDLAKDYLEMLQAPVKGFYTFERSAHSPIFEEPGRVRHILREDVLAGRVSLADVKKARAPS